MTFIDIDTVTRGRK